MKQRLLFLVLFLLLIGAIFLFKKSQILSPIISPTPPQGALSPIEEDSLTREQGLTLKIYQPQDGMVVNSASLTIKGKTSPFADVYINDRELKADSQGEFVTALVLDEGANSIIVVANDNQGNYTEKELTVTLETKE